MQSAAGKWTLKSCVREFFSVAWPVILPADSEAQRRRKMAVRSSQFTVVIIAFVPVTITLLSCYQKMSAVYGGTLVLASLAYIIWSLYGVRDSIRLMFWERGAADAPALTSRPPLGAVFYFGIQLFLAGLICFLSGISPDQNLIWLVMLPPVAHSVMLLRWYGVATVSLTTCAILSFAVAFWQSWRFVPEALLAYSFAIVFTLVFTFLSVSSERSRLQVEKLAHELGLANQKLREYAVQVEELAATRERNRLAREIHDGLGHYLTVINVQLETARTLWERDPAVARSALAKAHSLTDEGLKDIRRSVTSLRTASTNERPLIDSLTQVVNDSNAADLKVEMQVLGESRRLSAMTELVLYRACQEGLTNVRKHARTAHAWITVDFRAASKVNLQIRDKGIGAAETTTSGFGLLGLKERTTITGGSVIIQTAPQAGFVLEIEVPG